MKSYIKHPRAGSTSFTPAQLAKLYNFPTGLPAGGVIGIIELGGGYKPSDIGTAFSNWSLPTPQLTDVSVDGGANTPGGDADGEVVLDIQIAAAIYSYCTGKPAVIRVYFAPNTDSGFADAVAKATADGCTAISISWGGPEDAWSTTSIKSFDAVCAKARAAGVNVFAASGDNDSGDGERGNHVDFPASSPNVIGCGGTNKTSTSETVWNSGSSEGTGGGYSSVFPAQAWQLNVPAKTGRMVPDVAGVGDPATGYQIYLNGAWNVFGGTSCVAPLMAGLFAAIGVKDVLQKLWAIPQAFVDITAGNNGTYVAKVGPDPCTGLGVPDGGKLVAALMSTPPPPPPSPPSPPPPQPVPVTSITLSQLDLTAAGLAKFKSLGLTTFTLVLSK